MFSLKNILKEKFQCIWSEGVLVRVNKISNLHVLLSRCTLINIVTSKHNVTETFFQIFSVFFYHIKELMKISEF